MRPYGPWTYVNLHKCTPPRPLNKCIYIKEKRNIEILVGILQNYKHSWSLSSEIILLAIRSAWRETNNFCISFIFIFLQAPDTHIRLMQIRRQRGPHHPARTWMWIQCGSGYRLLKKFKYGNFLHMMKGMAFILWKKNTGSDSIIFIKNCCCRDPDPKDNLSADPSWPETLTSWDRYRTFCYNYFSTSLLKHSDPSTTARG